MRRTIATVLVVAMLVLAGCSSGLTGSDDTGTMNFYVSDQPGAIDDFQHLNVTLSSVTFVDAEGNQTTRDANATVDLTQLRGANSSLIDQYEVESGDYTKVFLNVSNIDGTLTSGESADVKLPSERLQLNQNFTIESGTSVDFVYDINVVKKGNQGYNLLPVASESGTDVEINEVDASVSSSASGEQSSMSTSTQGSLQFYMSDQPGAIEDFKHLNVTVTEVGFKQSGASNWTEFDVDNRTVDLTRLQGDNATLLESYNLSSGNYSTVFVHVSEVNGTLTSGESTDVKLPSSKIKITENFEIEANSTTNFVYDITVVKAGQSGSYNIQPVVSESGTDVPINPVDEKTRASLENSQSGDDETQTEDNETESDTETSLSASFEGNVTAGENVTVLVTQDGEPVEGAAVTHADGTVMTDANGEATVMVPSDTEQFELTVTHDGVETELTATVEAQLETTTTQTTQA